MGVTTTTNQQQQNRRLRTDRSLYLWGAKIAFYWYQIFALDSKKIYARMEAS